MGEVIAHLAMSLDGFIADPDDGCDELFGFYQSGDVSVKLSEGFPELHVSQTRADLLTRSVAKAGATVVGRRLYDLTNGWDGHPGGEVPMVVVTHHPPQDWPRGGAPTFFETSVEAAVAKARELAGEKDVDIAGATITRGCLDGRAAGRDPGQPGAGDPRRGDPVAGRHPRPGAPVRSRGG
jgi:dihydrofolate reductase